MNVNVNVKALVGAFNQEKALVGAFSVIVHPVVEPMEHYTALYYTILYCRSTSTAMQTSPTMRWCPTWCSGRRGAGED